MTQAPQEHGSERSSVGGKSELEVGRETASLTPGTAAQLRLQGLADQSGRVRQLQRAQSQMGNVVQRMRLSDTNSFYGDNQDPNGLNFAQASALWPSLPESDFDKLVFMADLPGIGLKWVEITPNDVPVIANKLGMFSGIEQVEESDEDHGVFDANVEEKPIDWNELTVSGLNRIPTDVLYRIFWNLAKEHYDKAEKEMPSDLSGAFLDWYTRGIVTRSRFKSIIGLSPKEDDDTTEIRQLARTGNTYSYNTGYKGPGSGGDYDNVIYYRDGVGNIDFTVDPTTIVKAYNKAHKEKIKASDINWTDPEKGGSEVQMSTDLKNPKDGVMPSGKKVKLPKASRAQHFAIADMLYPNTRTGKWTWHHLNEEYKMVLVDMRVHAKHGHNGGVYLWK